MEPKHLTTDQIVHKLYDTPGALYELRVKGHKKLVLSYSEKRGCFRYYKGARRGGGGRKHALCDENGARELLNRFPGGRLYLNVHNLSDFFASETT